MNHDEKERIAKVETQVSEMRLTVNETRTDVKKIMQNEIPHLKESILQLKLAFNNKIGKIDKKLGMLILKVSLLTTALVTALKYLLDYYLR